MNALAPNAQSRFAGRARTVARALALRRRDPVAPRDPRRILIAHHLLLGDTLMLTPLLKKLRTMHPQADIAMTHLFGGFHAAFYRGYEDEWPLPPGHELRRHIYNLYHIVNHLNLFGGSYRAQAEATIARLLRP